MFLKEILFLKEIFLYLFSFILIWFGAGLIVGSIDKLAHRFNLSSFAVSFFILGMLTSTPEMAVGISSIIDKKPEIFVGNLLGGSLILFIFVIPLLAVLGNGIKLAHQLNLKNLFLSLLVVSAPSFLIVDKKMGLFEALFLIFIYGYLFYAIEKKKGLLEKVKDKILDHRKDISFNILKLVFGLILVFFSSKFIVDKTIYFSSIFQVSPFIISLLFLSLGTNLPELSIAIRSVLLGKKEVAFGDYIGSASANTFIFGFLTIFNGKDLLVDNGFLLILLFTILGLGIFFYFCRSKNDISQKEGLILILIYILFLFLEVFKF